MTSTFRSNMDAVEQPNDYAAIERQLRNRLRLAQRIVVEETGSSAAEIVATVFEQLCFRYDETASFGETTPNGDRVKAH